MIDSNTAQYVRRWLSWTGEFVVILEFAYFVDSYITCVFVFYFLCDGVLACVCAVFLQRSVFIIAIYILKLCFLEKSCTSFPGVHLWSSIL